MDSKIEELVQKWHQYDNMVPLSNISINTKVEYGYDKC